MQMEVQSPSAAVDQSLITGENSFGEEIAGLFNMRSLSCLQSLLQT